MAPTSFVLSVKLMLNYLLTQINPDMDQSHQLKGWYETEGSTAHITALSTSTRGGGGASADFSSGSNMKTFGEAKQV